MIGIACGVVILVVSTITGQWSVLATVLAVICILGGMFVETYG